MVIVAPLPLAPCRGTVPEGAWGRCGKRSALGQRCAR